jgi:hypothetical protein
MPVPSTSSDEPCATRVLKVALDQPAEVRMRSVRSSRNPACAQAGFLFLYCVARLLFVHLAQKASQALLDLISGGQRQHLFCQ